MTTALSLVNTLRAKTRTVDAGSVHPDDYGWGTFKVLFLYAVLATVAKLAEFDISPS